MTTTTSDQAQPKIRLNDNELSAVVGGHQKFCYETKDGRTYAIGRVNGNTVAVRVE